MVTVLHRIGRLPDPFAYPSWEFIGGERFDDPLHQYRVLYTAEQRRACFLETLASFRPSLEVLARLRELPEADDGDALGVATPFAHDWRHRRRIVSLSLGTEPRWLDLRTIENREMLRRELAPVLARLGLADFDMGDALTRNRDVTQAISRWAYEQGYQAIAYPCRLDPTLTCWALFEGTEFTPRSSSPITADDPDLQSVAELFGIPL